MITELQNGLPLIESDFNSVKNKKQIRDQWGKGEMKDCPAGRAITRLFGVTMSYNTVMIDGVRYAIKNSLDEIYRAAKELRKGEPVSFLQVNDFAS